MRGVFMSNEAINLFFGFIGGLASYAIIEIVKAIKNYRGKFGIDVIHSYRTANRGLFYRIIYVDLYSTKIERAYIKDIKIIHEGVPGDFTTGIFLLKENVNDIDQFILKITPNMVKGDNVETRAFVPQWITTEKWIVTYTAGEYCYLIKHHPKIWVEYTTMDEKVIKIPVQDIEHTANSD